MEKKEVGWVSAVILGVPLIVAIVLAVLMAYVNLTKWTGGVRVSFGWQSEEMAELKDKLQSSFNALTETVASSDTRRGNEQSRLGRGSS